MKLIIKNTSVTERKPMTGARKSTNISMSFRTAHSGKSGIVKSYIANRAYALKNTVKTGIKKGLDKLGIYAQSLAGKIEQPQQSNEISNTNRNTTRIKPDITPQKKSGLLDSIIEKEHSKAIKVNDAIKPVIKVNKVGDPTKTRTFTLNKGGNPVDVVTKMNQAEHDRSREVKAKIKDLRDIIRAEKIATDGLIQKGRSDEVPELKKLVDAKKVELAGIYNRRSTLEPPPEAPKVEPMILVPVIEPPKPDINVSRTTLIHGLKDIQGRKVAAENAGHADLLTKVKSVTDTVNTEDELHHMTDKAFAAKHNGVPKKNVFNKTKIGDARLQAIHDIKNVLDAVKKTQEHGGDAVSLYAPAIEKIQSVMSGLRDDKLLSPEEHLKATGKEYTTIEKSTLEPIQKLRDIIDKHNKTIKHDVKTDAKTPVDTTPNSGDTNTQSQPLSIEPPQAKVEIGKMVLKLRAEADRKLAGIKDRKNKLKLKTKDKVIPDLTPDNNPKSGKFDAGYNKQKLDELLKQAETDKAIRTVKNLVSKIHTTVPTKIHQTRPNMIVDSYKNAGEVTKALNSPDEPNQGDVELIKQWGEFSKTPAADTLRQIVVDSIKKVKASNAAFQKNDRQATQSNLATPTLADQYAGETHDGITYPKKLYIVPKTASSTPIHMGSSYAEVEAARALYQKPVNTLAYIPYKHPVLKSKPIPNTTGVDKVAGEFFKYPPKTPSFRTRKKFGTRIGGVYYKRGSR